VPTTRKFLLAAAGLSLRAGANGNQQALAQAQSRSVPLGRLRPFAQDPASVYRTVSAIRHAPSINGNAHILAK